MTKKSKQEKLISQLKDGLKEIKELKAQQKEINETLKEQSIEYSNLIKAFNKSIPTGVYT